MAGKAKIGAGIALDGEKEFKQALSEINAGLKVNKSELELLSAEYANNADSTEALTKKGQALQNQIYSQVEKIETLEKALANSADKYGVADKKTLEWQASLNRAKTDLTKMNNDLDNNSKALNKGTSETGNFKNVLSTLANSLGMNVSPEISNLAGNIMGGAGIGAVGLVVGIGAAIVAAVKLGEALANIAIESSNLADDILTLSSQTGLSTKTIQEFNYASDLLDVSTETLTGSMAKMIMQMDNARKGTGDAAEAFNRLKVSVTGNDGQLKSSEAVFYEVIDALGRVSNATERDSIAMNIFGKSAQDLNPLIERGSSALREFGAEAQRTGAIMDDDVLNSYGQLNDAMVRLDSANTTLKNSFAALYTPALTYAVETITISIVAMAKAMQTVYEINEKVATSFANLLNLGVFSDDYSQKMRAYTEVNGKIVRTSTLNVPEYATGTSYHPGGRALVGEQGPEIVDLPRGSKVYPNGTYPTTNNNSSVQNVFNVTIAAETLQQATDAYKLLESLPQIYNAGEAF